MHPQSVLSKNKKPITIFHLKITSFMAMKNRCIFGPRYEKTSFLHISENKDADQHLFFAIQMVQSLFYLNP